MPTAADSNGLPRYVEGDVGSSGSFASLLNLGLGWISDALTALKSSVGTNGPAATLSLASGWEAFGLNQHQLINGEVEYTLLLRKGSSNAAYAAGDVIGTFPVGRRPRRQIFVYSGAKEIQIQTNGQLTAGTAQASGAGFFAISGSFKAA